MAHNPKPANDHQLRLRFDGGAAAINLHIHIHGPVTAAPQINREPEPVSETVLAIPEQDNAKLPEKARPHLIPPKAERPDPLVTRPPYPKPGTPEYDAHRVYLRDHLRYENRRLSGEFGKISGGGTTIQFSVFTREGMQGLYNNQDTRGLARQRGVKMGEFWQRAGIAELAVNLDRVIKTREALEDLRGSARTREIAMNEHHKVGTSLRAAFKKAHNGVAPEQLKAHPPLKDSRKRLRARAAEAKKAAKEAAKAKPAPKT